MENFTGELIAVSPIGKGVNPEKNCVLIKSEMFDSYKDSQRWFDLAENVKIEYCRIGPVSFSMSPDNEITYLKSSGNAGYSSYKSSSFGKKDSSGKGYSVPPSRGFNIEWEKEKQQVISRQAAVNSALELFKLNREELKGTVTVDQVIEIAKEFYAFNVNSKSE